MSLIPWKRDVFAPNELQREINRMFDDFFVVDPVRSQTPRFFPVVSVKDDEKNVTVSAEVPGLEAGDVNVQVTGNVLTLSGEKKQEKKEEKENFLRIERSYGSFLRRIELPGEVDADRAEAKLQNGVLELRLPKVESSASKTIKIKR
jgi:HSP20 family protein